MCSVSLRTEKSVYDREYSSCGSNPRHIAVFASRNTVSGSRNRVSGGKNCDMPWITATARIFAVVNWFLGPQRNTAHLLIGFTKFISESTWYLVMIIWECVPEKKRVPNRFAVLLSQFPVPRDMFDFLLSLMRFLPIRRGISSFITTSSSCENKNCWTSIDER